MAVGMPPMGGMPPQAPPQGGGSPLGQLGQKKSSPDSGAPLLQMIMTLLAGAGLKDFSSSLTSLMKGMGGGAHHKASGAPPGQQPSKGAPGTPMPPPNVASGAPPPGPAGGSPAPGGAGGLPPELLQKLMAMLMGGQGAQQPPPQQ